MNNAKNRVQLIGRLGADPDVKTFDSNKKVARLNIATNESYKNDKNEWVEQTQWHNVVLWGKLAVKAEENLFKGMEVMIEGKLVHRQYTDKEGVKRNITEVEGNDLILMGLKKVPAVES